METILAFLFASALGGAAGSAVAIVLIPRQIAVRDVEASASLTEAMTILSKELARQKMRSVRASAASAGHAPEQPPLPAPLTGAALKAHLRQLRDLKGTVQ